MLGITMPTPLNAATGRTELALAVAAAAALPLRLALHYASSPPPSRPMAALIVAPPAGRYDETTDVGYETLPAVVSDRAA